MLHETFDLRHTRALSGLDLKVEIMSDNFYGRQQEIKAQQERLKHQDMHGTVETVRLESERAADGKSPAKSTAELEQDEKGLMGRIKHLFRLLTGSK
jgi:hypothetical protein